MCNSKLSPGIIEGIGAGVKALGTLQAGNEAAKVGEANAKRAEMEAIDALSRGSSEELRYRREVAQVLGAQRATFGARNVSGSTGTALDLQGDTAAIGEMDALTIRNNAAREALSLRTQAQESRRQGRAAKANSRTAALGGLLLDGSHAWGTYREGKK